MAQKHTISQRGKRGDFPSHRCKDSTCNAGDSDSTPGSGGFPWRRKWQPTRILAWEIPWTEELGRLQSIGSPRVRHDLATKQQTPPVGQTPGEETGSGTQQTRVLFLPALSQGEIKHHVEKEVCKLCHMPPKGMPKNEPFSKILAAVPRFPGCGPIGQRAEPVSASSRAASPPHRAPRADWSPSVCAVHSTMTEKWLTLGYFPSPRVLI